MVTLTELVIGTKDQLYNRRGNNVATMLDGCKEVDALAPRDFSVLCWQ